MPQDFPNSDTRHPILLHDGTRHKGAVFLKAAVDHPRMQVGEYTYASAFDPPEDWQARLAPYLFGLSAERLVIGKFCQIADGVRFITASANHRYDGFSSYPFAVFDRKGWMERPSLPGPGPDTVIGHDVWLGQGVQVLPGAQIGDGVIVGAGAVVGGVVPPYSVVAGNPATVRRRRFDDETIDRLLALRWWDWPIDVIIAHEAEICGGDLDALEAAKPASAASD